MEWDCHCGPIRRGTMPSSGAASRRCLDQWSIAGEVTLIGDPSARIRLAGFYTSRHDFFYFTSPSASRIGCAGSPARLVTTVAEFGREGGEFSLCFDVGSLAPAAGEYIYLILWADLNDNGAFDPGEEWSYVVPLYDDRVFCGATDCVFYFDERPHQEKGTQPGWNVSRGLERYAPVESPEQVGARLANETAWTARSVPGT